MFVDASVLDFVYGDDEIPAPLNPMPFHIEF
jgi:hypothetical protein